MAKRKKRAKVQPKKRARPPRESAAKARKVSSARGKTTKRMVASAKPKRATIKKAVRKKEQRMKPPGPGVETVVVDVIEEPPPGVITITEIEETQIAAGRNEPEECWRFYLSVCRSSSGLSRARHVAISGGPFG